jgi:hypothetical protein
MRALALALTLSLTTASLPAAAFDFETGNGATEVVITTAVPTIFGRYPSGSEASFILRITTLLTNAWFDSTAPYTPSAVGVYSRLGRRPASEYVDNTNQNIALITASYHVFNSLFPAQEQEWRNMMYDNGLDPDDDSEDLTTPTGIGNAAGHAIVEAREHDGMNQLGDEGRAYHFQPYRDYTGYEPVNTAYRLTHPGRWQPFMASLPTGLQRITGHESPQWAYTDSYTGFNMRQFRLPVPNKSLRPNSAGYRSQVDEIIRTQVSLTDKQKLIAEFFNNKVLSLGFSIVFIAQARGLSLREFIELDFLTNMAAFDMGIATWDNKLFYDTVRPFSAIRHVYGNRTIRGWVGPGKGMVNNLPASEWQSYLVAPGHSEYPSGSTSFCEAHAQATRRYLGDDNLGWSIPHAVGSSVIEPGVTPAAPTTLTFNTWTEFARDCGESRIYGGVHFRDAVENVRPAGRRMGNIAYEFVKAHIDGTIDGGGGCP